MQPGRYKPGKPMAEMQMILLPEWRRLIYSLSPQCGNELHSGIVQKGFSGL